MEIIICDMYILYIYVLHMYYMTSFIDEKDHYVLG